MMSLPHKQLQFFRVLVFFALAIVPQLVRGQTTRAWLQPSPADISQVANWNIQSQFNPSDILVIGANPTASGQFSQSANLTINQLRYSNTQSLTLNQLGRTLTLTGANAAILNETGFGILPDFTITGGVVSLGSTTRVGSSWGGSNAIVLNSQVSGSTLQASGKVVLGNTSNTFMGNVLIEDGASVYARNIANRGNFSSLGAGAAISFTGTALSSLNFVETGAGGVTDRDFAVGNAHAVLNVGSSNSVTLTGIIDSNNAATLFKDGLGTLNISGSPKGGMHGTLAVGRGTVNLQTQDIFGNGKLRVSGGTVNFGITQQTFQELSGSSGTISLAQGLVLQQNSDTTYSGAISGTGYLDKRLAGNLTLSGANTYTGATNVLGGRLTLGANNVLADSTAVNVASGATFDVNGRTDTIGSLSGGGHVVLGSNGHLSLNSNSNTTFAGVISGTGSLTKLGTGGMTLSGANTYTGATNINAGTLTLGANNVLSDSTAVNVASGATFNVNGRTDTIGSLNGSGNVTMGSGGRLSLSSNSNSIFSGTIAGSGSIWTSGSSSLVLSGMNTFSGEFYILGDTISGNTLGNIGVASAFGTSSDTGYIGFLGGATFEYTGATTSTNRNLSGDGANIRITEAGTNLTWNGAMEGFIQVNKSGAGTLTIGSTGGLSTERLYVDGGVLAVGANQAIVSPAPGGLTDVTVGAAGTLRVAGVAQQLGSLDSYGTLQVNSGAQLSAGNLTNGGSVSVDGGSTLAANSLQNTTGGSISLTNNSTLTASTLQNDFGGSITLDSSSHLIASSLINNGEIFGNVDLVSGQTLSGTGTIFGMTTIDNGSVIAPGNSIGTMNLSDLTWGPGGIYDWEIANALGTPGSEWDFIDLTGSLNITATAFDPFSINLLAFGGPVANFDASQNYSWSLLSANGGIFGFDSSNFLLNPSGFSNPYTGTFSLSQSGNSLNLLYTANAAAVPEPGSMLLLSIGAVIGAVRYRRRSES